MSASLNSRPPFNPLDFCISPSFARPLVSLFGFDDSEHLVELQNPQFQDKQRITSLIKDYVEAGRS